MMDDEPNWTHKGLFLSFIPVLVADIECADPVMTGRWFWADWLFYIAEPPFNLFLMVMSFMNPDFEPSFPVRITGTIAGSKR